eukprot:TRINITY_DN74861_c0_g1_i1.p1 TRINITY_DN74861_c0_g1~~TRINITY_DN74861_c0_g1_i1.p1  ORF type:complete len:469 (-),score=73.26 TRINITY_DN74861_c0_g1_i1:111-1451(-)
MVGFAGATFDSRAAAMTGIPTPRWRCECCGQLTPPIVGRLIRGARHRCRSCNRTVCGECSTIPLGGARSCQGCYFRADETRRNLARPREKYIFLVRHAESTWNQNVDLVKALPTISFQAMSFKDVVSRAAHLMAKEMWNRDHPISQHGARQAEMLRQKIAASRSYETERERRYYDSFATARKQDGPVYSSPLLRAVQTAHLTLQERDGWGPIKLIKEARERFRFVFERDCLGTGVGAQIVDRATNMCENLHGLRDRVDATDCAQKWWSDDPETDAGLDARLTALWKKLFEESGDESCVLVTHSNLIKALLMRFGGLEEGEDMEEIGNDDEVAVQRRQHLQGSAGAEALQGDDSDDTETDEEATGKCWQFVDGGSECMRRLKVERLQNCGVLGLRCVLEAPPLQPYPEVDGWVDIDAHLAASTDQGGLEQMWIAKDAMLMFDSVLVK